jgi:hypothetical protein
MSEQIEFDKIWASDIVPDRYNPKMSARAIWDHQQSHVNKLEAELNLEKEIVYSWADKIINLEKEIERMKNCGNCKYKNGVCTNGSKSRLCGDSYSLWELR